MAIGPGPLRVCAVQRRRSPEAYRGEREHLGGVSRRSCSWLADVGVTRPAEAPVVAKSLITDHHVALLRRLLHSRGW